MHYILFYKTVGNYIEKRAPYREEHLKLVHGASESGSLVMAGAFADELGGAALVFTGESPEVAEKFAENDPMLRTA